MRLSPTIPHSLNFFQNVCLLRTPATSPFLHQPLHAGILNKSVLGSWRSLHNFLPTKSWSNSWVWKYNPCHFSRQHETWPEGAWVSSGACCNLQLLLEVTFFPPEVLGGRELWSFSSVGFLLVTPLSMHYWAFPPSSLKCLHVTGCEVPWLWGHILKPLFHYSWEESWNFSSRKQNKKEPSPRVDTLFAEKYQLAKFGCRFSF